MPVGGGAAAGLWLRRGAGLAEVSAPGREPGCSPLPRGSAPASRPPCPPPLPSFLHSDLTARSPRPSSRLPQDLCTRHTCCCLAHTPSCHSSEGSTHSLSITCCTFYVAFVTSSIISWVSLGFLCRDPSLLTSTVSSLGQRPCPPCPKPSTVPGTQLAFNKYSVNKWFQAGRGRPRGALRHVGHPKPNVKAAAWGQWRPTEPKSDSNSAAESSASLGRWPHVSELYPHLESGRRAPPFPSVTTSKGQSIRACDLPATLRNRLSNEEGALVSAGLSESPCGHTWPGRH